MCGINGIYNKHNLGSKSISDAVNSMNNAIIHRGPDDSGIFSLKSEKGYEIAMGMQRLAIIDLHSGEQPIYSKDKTIVIVFNGEIYNYKILRDTLVAENIEFETQSDTEVILKLYEQHGPSAFDMLDGMFAFSIYDKNINKVFIARDFFGEKPLYYYHNAASFHWASELKSILKVLPVVPGISKKALSLYFQLTYIPAPYSIYDGILKLEANHYISFDCISNSFEIMPVSKEIVSPIQDISFPEAKKEVRSRVKETVKSRAISDVGKGAFLSGGVDSSIVSLCLAECESNTIDTFSIGFEKKSFNETDKSRYVAKMIDSNHHELILTEDDIKKDIHKVLLNFDEPFADSSALPSYLVSNYTSKHVKMALTGDGGDEVFGGYNKYLMGRLNNSYTNWVPKMVNDSLLKVAGTIFKTKDDSRGKRFKLNRLINAIDYDGNYYYNIISLGFQQHELSQLFHASSLYENALKNYKQNSASTLAEFREIDRRLSLEGDLLVKVDRTSMLNSLECRAPFLNKELWRFTNTLPEHFLLKGWNKKYILKEAFSEDFPKGFLDKSKKGFGVPVGDWLRSELKPELLTYIERNFLEKQQLFNVSFIQKMVNDHISGKIDNTFRVWTFYCFQKWFKNSIFHIEN